MMEQPVSMSRARLVREQEVVGSIPATPTNALPMTDDVGRAFSLSFLGDFEEVTNAIPSRAEVAILSPNDPF